MADPFAQRIGSFNGAPAPFPTSGVAARFLPHWLMMSGTTGNTSALGRLYYIRYYFTHLVAYSGLIVPNMGAGDSGEKARVGVYTESQTTGLPSALVVDCGEVTFGGSAAENLAATSWTPPYIGWGYLAIHTNAVSALNRYFAIITAGPGPNLANMVGLPAASTNNANTGAEIACHYTDAQAYGALQTVAPVPTAMIGTFPCVYPYRT